MKWFVTSLAQMNIAQFASISCFISFFIFESSLEWKTHLPTHFTFMWTFSCVFTFTGLLACVSVLDLEYSHFLLEYPAIRAWPISKQNLNWSYLFTEVRHLEFSLYSNNEFTTAASIRKKNRYFHAFLKFLPTLYLLQYWLNASIKLYDLLY